MDHDAFVARFGGVFEASPWVAERAWAARPFGSLDALYGVMLDAVTRAPREVRMGLIRSHPDLAGNVSLTDESEREQAAAGLDRLTPEQFQRITWLTTAYRARFGFPFIVCAREHTPDTIIAAAAQRTESGAEEEEQTALSEIAKIARLRLADLVAP
ncbi:MAG TPA: 2-oxo-4-hydroxy-4-carboxy-5-ureidoimidazoline decarboxylase [Solirubrobacteraceae bacterium]|nr:2-oxo-4-hydroxy-4-carboxy-5-ureidoimidazoline decarboxylase [Solirubrobacteraceae bacterium]